MYIIVIGGGDVGFYLTKRLLEEGHEIVIIEKDRRKYEVIAEELGDIAIHGDGCEAAVLEEAGAGRADIFIAVTGNDEDNLVSCQLAKKRFKVSRTIARLKDPRNEALFRRLGIDVILNNTELILAHIERELPFSCVVPLVKLQDNRYEVVEVKVPSHAPNIGKRLKDILLPPDSFIVFLLSKERGPLVPDPETRIGPEDQIVAVITPQNKDLLKAALLGV